MNLWQAAVLGLIQGLTEFLPVSSSGHLVIADKLLGLPTGDLLFDVVVHVATLAAVVAYYRTDLTAIVKGLISPSMPETAGMSGRRWVALIVLGTIPAVIVGFGLKATIEAAFGDPRGVGFNLMATGAVLFSTLPLVGRRLRIGWLSALIIGIAQSVAILPGVSRSGSTIAAAMWLGVDRTQAARYSFLLSIPAIAGAFVLHVADFIHAGGTLSGVAWGPMCVAFVLAAVSGYVAVAAILRALVHRWFGHFGIWCWIVGILVLWQW